jgi:hypothetical protein
MHILPSPKYKQTQALHDDQQYSRVDAMKKRAIKTVASYDEFKNLVACAHLTPLSRREIDCLGHVKQGWKGQHRGGIKGKVRGMSKSRVHRADGNAGAVPLSSSSSSSSSIISSLAFEKAWSRMQQRHHTPEEKMAYLLSVGGADFLRRCFGGGGDNTEKKKVKKEMSAEILGDILTTLHYTYIQRETEESALVLLLQFLYALTQTGRFHITYALLTRPQQEAAHEMVRMLGEKEKEEQACLEGEEGSKRLLETIQEAFQCV